MKNYFTSKFFAFLFSAIFISICNFQSLSLNIYVPTSCNVSGLPNVLSGISSGQVSIIGSTCTLSGINDNIYFYGTITTDISLNIQNCPNIYFGPNAGILTPNGFPVQINITNSTLASDLTQTSVQLWLGIIMSEPNATLNVTNSTILRACTAIYLNTGLYSSGHCGSLQLLNSNIIDCWEGVWIQGIPNTPPTITGNVLTSDQGGSLAFNTPGLSSLTYLPTNSWHSIEGDKAFWITNNAGQQITIGALAPASTITAANNANYIRSWNTEVYCEQNFDLVVEGCYMDHADSIVSSFINPPYTGHTIYAFSNAGTATSPKPNLKVGDPNPLGGNSFTEIGVTSIYTVNTLNLNVQNNISVEPGYSHIDVERNIYGNVVIANNTLTTFCQCPSTVFSGCNPQAAVPRGIIVQKMVYGNLNIFNNGILLLNPGRSSSSSAGIGTGTIGIFLNYVGNSTTPGNLSITQNTISKSSFGIFTQNCSYLNISQNDIYLRPNNWTSNAPDVSYPPAYWAGMYSIHDLSNVQFSNNSITLDADPTAPPYPNYTGSAVIQGKLYGLLMIANGKGMAANCNTFTNMHLGFTDGGPVSGFNVPLTNNTFSRNQVGIMLINNGFIGNQGNKSISNDNIWSNCSFTLGTYLTSASNQYFFERSIYPLSTDLFYTDPLTTYFPPSYCTFPNPYTITPSNPLASCSLVIPHYPLSSEYDSAQLSALASGDLSFIDSPTATQEWVSDVLMQSVLQDPWLLDSIPALDSFAAVAAEQGFATLLDVSQVMTNPNDSELQVEALLAQNAGVDPSTQNEANCKAINDVYLRNFAKGIYALDSLDLATVLFVAQQCYLTGGPSVFYARSMYWIATGSSDLMFVDDCLYNTGYFHRGPGDSTSVASKNFLELFPTLANEQSLINIRTNYFGNLYLYDLTGRLLYTGQFAPGDNLVSCAQIACSEGVLVYHTIGADGTEKDGKILIIK